MTDKIKSKKRNTPKKSKEAFNVRGRFKQPIVKKNELYLIGLGVVIVAIVTVIFYFIFFKPADRKNVVGNEEIEISVNKDNLKNQINRLEGLADEEKIKKPVEQAESETKKRYDSERYGRRIEEVEKRVTERLEMLGDKIDSLERDIKRLSENVSKLTVHPPPQPVKKQEIKIFKKKQTHHTVKKGETLYSISRDYNTTVDELIELNNLDQKDAIFPGDILVVK